MRGCGEAGRGPPTRRHTTSWDSYEAIERFSGPDRDTAIYYPEDPAFLLALEPKVVHYEVVG